MFSLRVKKAYEFYVFRNIKQTAESHDDAYHIEYAFLSDKEDSELDGNFPLGNEGDVVFISDFFSTRELVLIQLNFLMKYTAEIIPNIVPTF